MNRIDLIGNVTKDIELVGQNGNIVNFDLAVRRRYPDKDGNEIVDFHKCVAYGKLAETITKYTKKGNKLYVSGELIYDNFVDRQGQNRTVPKIIVTQVEFLTPKKVESVEDNSGEENPSPEDLKLVKLDDNSLPF